MAAAEALIAAVDQVIDYFNARRMDLPDGLFDRRTQFVINGRAFEAFLSAAPSDPLVMMLARGPAGFRFIAKALQHAMPDARLDRGEITGDASPIDLTLSLSGKLRGTDDAVNVLIAVSLRRSPAGPVESAEATMDPAILQSIHAARLRT
jgi:hypothetical protein